MKKLSEQSTRWLQARRAEIKVLLNANYGKHANNILKSSKIDYLTIYQELADIKAELRRRDDNAV